jgi:eukaryotic-like serine/threonine-protein kinase
MIGMALACTDAKSSLPFTQTEQQNRPSPGESSIRCFGDYELLDEIARGGMGIVYRARQKSLNRIVAVKVLLFGEFSSDDFVRRFEAEAEAVAALQHPNIVAIHEIGEHDGQRYFSMDYVAGRSLAEIVRECALPPCEAARLLQKLSEAVHYAHQHGVLHRDLKPSNVLIDEFAQPRLTDFGLAKRFEGEATPIPSGQLIGSPNYIAPEQADPRRGGAGPVADVYSLGAILYHSLTARPPFVAESLEQTVHQVLHDEPLPPRVLSSNVPRDLETICLKCLQKNPQRRYLSAQDLADDLSRFLRNEPIRARAIGPVEKLVRAVRRRPALALAVLFLTMAAVGSTLIALHLAQLNHAARWHAYVSEMDQAQREWQEKNFAQAFYYLQRQIPTGRERDLRGFEWRHLWNLTRGNCAFRLPRHAQVVGWLGFSPDAQLFATFTWDASNTVKVFDVTARELRWRIDDATSVGGFSKDGEWFVAGHANGSIATYQAKTGKLLSTLSGVGDIVAFAPEPRLAVAMDTNRVLKVVELVTQRAGLILTNAARRHFDSGKGAPLAITADGRWLALIRPGDALDGNDRGIEIWNTARGTMEIFLARRGQIRTLLFSPDNKTLATADASGTLALWNWATGENQSVQAHDLPIQSIAFSVNGETLATGGSDEFVKLWDARTLQRKPRQLEGQIGAVWSLAFSPDDRFIASGTRDMPISFWEVKTDQPFSTIEGLKSDMIGNFAFSPNGKLMAGGCKDGSVRVWDVQTMREKYRLKGVSYVVAFTLDGDRLLVSTDQGVAQWWDFKSGAHQAVPAYGSFGEITSVDFSPDRRVAAVGHKSGIIQLLEIDTGKVLGTYEEHKDAVLSVTFTPSGRQFASGSRDKTIRFWDVDVTNRSYRICAEHKGAVAGLAISGNGKIMVSGCSANTIKFWDLRHLDNSLGSLSWHRSAIRTLAFSPDANTLASGSEDKSVKLWDFTTRRQLASFKFSAAIQLVVFSPDGESLAVVTDKGSLHLLRTATLEDAGTEIRTLYLRQ